jgi:hypothetical protein
MGLAASREAKDDADWWTAQPCPPAAEAAPLGPASSRGSGAAAGPEAQAAAPGAASLAPMAGRPTGEGCKLSSPACQAAAAWQEGGGGGASGEEPAGSGLGAAAGTGAGPAGLADMLHGAPALLAAIMAASSRHGGDNTVQWPSIMGERMLPWGGCRRARVARACCEAVDAAATRLWLDFDPARRAAAPACLEVDVDARQEGGHGGPAYQAAPMVRRLAKAPALTELHCSNPRGAELEQLLAGAAAAQPSAVAGVQRLVVHCESSVRCLPGIYNAGLPALLRSLAHLPSLQVRLRGCGARTRLSACKRSNGAHGARLGPVDCGLNEKRWPHPQPPRRAGGHTL